ncbi:hypothetical protein [Mucilaginibacter sp.]
MSKKVLAIYYSQSGQLGEIVASFTAPLAAAGAEVETVVVQPTTPYAFPWTGKRFFDVMPDCVLGNTIELQPLHFKHQQYDLIVLGYQSWFLSPSIPVNSLLHHPQFRALLKDTPVITLTGARNMWLNAFERVRQTLKEAGAKLVGNLALVDNHHNAISFVTIFYWMLTGKKDRYLNLFPKPGIADADIAGMAVQGAEVVPLLNTQQWNGLQQQWIDKKAVTIKYQLMFTEIKAKTIYAAWAKFIVKRKNRDLWISVFKYYLLVAFFAGAPVLMGIDALLIKPFSAKRIKARKNYYLQIPNS